MITCETVPIPEGRAVALRKWLDMPELQTLVEVIEAKQKRAECEALKHAVTTEEFPLHKDKSDQFIREAQKCQHFLDLLEEILEAEQFNSVKLT